MTYFWKLGRITKIKTFEGAGAKSEHSGWTKKAACLKHIQGERHPWYSPSFNFFSFFFVLFPETASDCHELFMRGETTSGVYTIQPANSEPFEVFCEMTAGTWSKTPLDFEPAVSSDGICSDHSFSVFLSRRRMDSDSEAPRWFSGLWPAVGCLRERLRQPEW